MHLYIARDYDKNSENWISWFFITRRQWTDAVELLKAIPLSRYQSMPKHLFEVRVQCKTREAN